MLLTVHAAVGGAIGKRVASAALAFVLGLISHFILDMVPHGDEHHIEQYRSGQHLKKILTITLIDLLATFIVILSIANINLNSPYFQSIMWGILGGVLPDFLVGIYEIFPTRKLELIHRWHFKIHGYFERKYNFNFRPAMIIQIIILILVLF